MAADAGTALSKYQENYPLLRRSMSWSFTPLRASAIPTPSLTTLSMLPWSKLSSLIDDFKKSECYHSDFL